MLTFRECPKPQPHELAINVANGPHNQYAGQLEAHQAHWEKRANKIDHLGDLVIGELAAVFVDSFKLNRRFKKNEENIRKMFPEKYEGCRVSALNHIAQSSLMRHVIGMGEHFSGEFGLLFENIRSSDGENQLFSEPLYDDENGRPFDLRLHTSRSLADVIVQPYEGDGPTEIWYRSKNLFVRRTSWAEPSAPYVEIAQERPDIPADFSGLQTLFPYVPSQ